MTEKSSEDLFIPNTWGFMSLMVDHIVDLITKAFSRKALTLQLKVKLTDVYVMFGNSFLYVMFCNGFLFKRVLKITIPEVVCMIQAKRNQP